MKCNAIVNLELFYIGNVRHKLVGVAYTDTLIPA